MLSAFFWVWAFYWSVVDLLGATPLQNEFFLPQKPSAVPISSAKGGGVWRPSHSMREGWLVWSSAGKCSCCGVMGAVVLSRRHCFAPVPPDLWLLCCGSDLPRSLSLGKRCEIGVLFVMYFPHFGQLWVSALTTCCTKKLLCWDRSAVR